MMPDDGAPQSDDPDDAIDEASMESFPASDPPNWEPLHVGKPSAAIPAVENNVQSERFEIRTAQGIAHLKYRHRDDGVLTLVHTEVPREMGGQGYASELARTALEYAASNHLRVVVICPFVKAYLVRHPEFASLVVA